MNEKFNEYRDLIQRMEAMPQVNPPSGFTERVMGRLPELDQGVWAKAKSFLFIPSWAGIRAQWAQMLSVSNRRECSFCFFISGFFYFIMGIIAMAGLKAITSNIAALDWIQLQPHLIIGTAIWLLFLGMTLLREGSAAMKIVRYGTLLYIYITLLNGIFISSRFHAPYADIFIIGLTAGGVCMGVMLALAVDRVALRIEK